jgi:hypothetical protein
MSFWPCCAKKDAAPLASQPETNKIKVGTSQLDRRYQRLLTEKEVSTSWRNLFKGRELNDEAFEKAEALLEELRPESPLRHRLAGELEELRRLAVAK